MSHNSGVYATITCICFFRYLKSALFQKGYETTELNVGSGVRLPDSDPPST